MICGRRVVLHGGSRLARAFPRLSLAGVFTSGFAVAVQLLSHCSGAWDGGCRWRLDV